MGGLGIEWLHAVALFEYIQQMMSINEQAGEKNIPLKLKQRHGNIGGRGIDIESEDCRTILNEVDEFICEKFGVGNRILQYYLTEDLVLWGKNR